MPDEPMNLGLLLFVPYRAMESEVLAELRAHGHSLTTSQARVFQRIGPQGSRPGELAEAAQLTKQTLSSILDQLESAGYVARVPDPSDGRGRLVTITPAGRELVELSLPVVRAIEAAWTEHLGPTRTRQLRETLTELRTITDPFADVTDVS
jgi:DNA-binding MarR family transcriptional regulator